MDVEFSEPTAVQPLATRESKGLTKLVIGWGLAKDEAGAQKVLLMTLVICVGIIGITMWFGGGDVEQPPQEVFQGM